jgi:hypothetical protein
LVKNDDCDDDESYVDNETMGCHNEDNAKYHCEEFQDIEDPHESNAANVGSQWAWTQLPYLLTVMLTGILLWESSGASA